MTVYDCSQCYLLFMTVYDCSQCYLLTIKYDIGTNNRPIGTAGLSFINEPSMSVRQFLYDMLLEVSSLNFDSGRTNMTPDLSLILGPIDIH